MKKRTIKAVDSLIEELSNYIKENIEKNNIPMEIEIETAEMTKALAELMSARASFEIN